MLSIQGPQQLEGSVKISGSKNAALPLIACGLFFETFTLHNVPRIGDVFTFLAILESLGVSVQFEGNTLTLDTRHISLAGLNRDLIKKIRVGIILFPPLLYRFGELNIPYPGGCYIGKRPITEHLHAFKSFGYTGTGNHENISFFGKDHKKDLTLSAGFSVTATENILMMAAFRSQKTTIQLAAIEPHVMNLIEFLQSIGVSITLRHDHTIEIQGQSSIPAHAEATVIADYIESGTFVILGALAARHSIKIEHARVHDLTLFLEKCREAGVRMDIDHDTDSIIVYNSQNTLTAVNVQTNIYPGFPTDLQSPFTLLLTQAEGTSRIHEILFE